MSAGKTGTGARLAFAALAALIVALAAAPARAVEWETYLSDDFNGADSMFYTGQAGEAYYSLDAGRYVIDGMNTGVDSLSALTDNLYYYYVEAQCELLDSTAGELAFSGVVFHYNKKIQGKLSYYVFYAYGDGYYGAKRVIGDQVEIVLPLARSEMLDAGRPNILGVDCQGTRFDLYINGRYVDGFTDVRVDGGGCGFYVSKFSKASFDSFAVKVEHRGGSVIPPEAPLTVEGSGPSNNGAEASPPGMAPDNSTPAGTQESGHSFLGYKAPVIPKDPNRPVYPWEVGVDKTGKGNKNTSTGGDGGSGAGNTSVPPRDTVAPAVAPPGSSSAAQSQHPASQAAPEQTATKLSPAYPPTESTTAIPPGVRGDLPHQSIRDAGEPGELPGNTAAPSTPAGSRQQQPVLPEGEVLLPDDTSDYARPNPPEQIQAGTSDVALVPAGEADELAAQQAANAGAGEAESPSALGNANPASAAGNVLKRVRTSETSQPKPDLLHTSKTSVQRADETRAADPPVEPAADPPAQPEAQPDTGVKEAVLPPANGLDPQLEAAPVAEPEAETADTAQAGSGDELSLFGNSSGAEAKPATDTAQAAQPAADTTPELKPEGAVASTSTEPPSPGAPRPDAAQASAYFSGAGAVQIIDDFTQQTWPVSESGPSTYRYFGAAYEVDNLSADTMAISFQEAALADCELTIAAEFLDGASYVGYGAAARFSVDEAGVSYYGLFISRSGEFLLLKVVDGVETVLKDWTASTLINPSLANKVTLEVVGKRLTAYVNGTAVASVQDASLTAGGYALLAGPGVKVRYDDLLIRGYPAK